MKSIRTLVVVSDLHAGSRLGLAPAWQLRTPFCFKVPGARVSSPQIGGVIIRSVDGYLFTIPFVKHIARDDPE